MSNIPTEETHELASWEELNERYEGNFEKVFADGWKFNWGAFSRKKKK